MASNNNNDNNNNNNNNTNSSSLDIDDFEIVKNEEPEPIYDFEFVDPKYTFSDIIYYGMKYQLMDAYDKTFDVTQALSNIKEAAYNNFFELSGAEFVAYLCKFLEILHAVVSCDIIEILKLLNTLKDTNLGQLCIEEATQMFDNFVEHLNNSFRNTAYLKFTEFWNSQNSIVQKIIKEVGSYVLGNFLSPQEISSIINGHLLRLCINKLQVHSMFMCSSLSGNITSPTRREITSSAN